MSKNKVTFGLSNVHVAFFDEEQETQPAYKTPIALKGTVKISLKAEGDSTPFYADNIVYFQADSNNGYTGDLEIALVDDETKKEMYGWEIDDSGALVEVTNGKPKPYALMGEINGDKANRRFIYYNCQSSRSDIENKSQDKSVDINTEKMGFSAHSIEIGGKNIVKAAITLDDNNKQVYDKFFESVFLPTFTPEA